MKQKRGIRFIVGVLLAVLVVSQASFFVNIQVAKASDLDGFLDGSGQLISSIPALIPPAIKLGGDPSSGCPQMMDYFIKNIYNVSPQTFPAFQGKIGSDFWETIHHDTYDDCLATVDQNWDNQTASFVSDYAKMLLINPSDGSHTITQGYTNDFNAQLDELKAKIIPQILLYLAGTYSGVYILQAVDQAPAGSAGVAIKQAAQAKISSSNSQDTWDWQVKDLDWHNDGAALSQDGNKYIFKVDIPAYVANNGGSTSPYRNVTSIYDSTAHFYSDASPLMQAVINLQDIATDDPNALTVLANDQAILKQAAQASSSLSGITADATGQCGTPASILSGEIVKALQQAMCGLVITGAQINLSIVQTGAYVAAKMIPIDASGLPTNNILIGLIPKELLPDQILKTLDTTPVVADAENIIIRALGSLVIFGLLIIALANILQIQLNLYAIKKAVPALIIGFLLALSAPFATKVCIEFANNISQFVLSPHLNGGHVINMNDIAMHVTTLNGANPSTLKFVTGGGGVDTGGVFLQLILDIVGLIAAILMIILGFLFVIRSIIFIFLVPLSPIAFFGVTFEPLNGIWQRWWKLTQSWLFMNSVSAFWIWLMYVFYKEAGSTVGVTNDLIGFGAGTVCLWFAVTTPFKMAGEAKAVMSKIEKGLNTARNKAWSATGGAAGKYAKDQAGIYWNRNQLVQAAKGKLQTYKDERQHEIDFAKKGLNYKAMKRDAEKVADIAKNEDELMTINKDIPRLERKLADEQKNLADALAKGDGDKEQDARNAIAQVIADLDHSEQKKIELKATAKKLNRQLPWASRSNLASLKREMFKTTREDEHKEKEEVMRKSAQAIVAQKNHAYQELDGELRDLKARKEDVGYIGKSELDEIYRTGGTEEGAKATALAEKRQFRAAKVAAGKGLDANRAADDELDSATKYIMALRNPDLTGISDVTAEEKMASSDQGAKIRDWVHEDSKKLPKGYGMGKGKIISDFIVGNDIDLNENPLDLRLSAGSVGRMWWRMSDHPSLEDMGKMKTALLAMKKRVEEAVPNNTKAAENKAKFLAELGTESTLDANKKRIPGTGSGFIKMAEDTINLPGSGTDTDRLKKFIGQFKDSDIGKRVNRVYQDAHWEMVGSEFGKL